MTAISTVIYENLSGKMLQLLARYMLGYNAMQAANSCMLSVHVVHTDADDPS